MGWASIDDVYSGFMIASLVGDPIAKAAAEVKYRPIVEKLKEYGHKNTAWKEKFEDSLNRKDSALSASILNSSPVGSAVQAARVAAAKNRNELKDNRQKYSENNSNLDKAADALMAEWQDESTLLGKGVTELKKLATNSDAAKAANDLINGGMHAI